MESQISASLGGDEAREVPVDPSADDDHGEDVGEVSLEHLGHHGGVRHRVGRRHVPLLRLQDAPPSHTRIIIYNGHRDFSLVVAGHYITK